MPLTNRTRVASKSLGRTGRVIVNDVMTDSFLGVDVVVAVFSLMLQIACHFRRDLIQTQILTIIFVNVKLKLMLFDVSEFHLFL
jgi:hypothetical protein